MNRNNMALIGVVAFLVVGLGLTALLLMGRSPAPVPTPGQGAQAAPPARKVWVAKREISPRTVITQDMLSESSEPAPPGAISDPNQVIGKLADDTIYKGEAITADMTIAPLKRVVPANIEIPEDRLRAVAVWVDPQQTAAGLVDKGDRVDVIVTHKLKIKTLDGDTGDIVSGRTVAQDLEVLAVDRSINTQTAPTPAPGQPGAPGAAGAPPPPPPPPTPAPPPGQKAFTRVMLAATPDVAERLVAANVMGELHLTIRDPRTRENFRIAEAMEYPTRTVDAITRKRLEARVTEETEIRKSERDLRMEARRRDLANRYAPRLPAMPGPMPPMPIGTLPPPAEPSGHEITVVRGTEKTRVVVPR